MCKYKEEFTKEELLIIKEASGKLTFKELADKMGAEHTTLRRRVSYNKVPFIARERELKAPRSIGSAKAPMTKIWGMDEDTGETVELLTDLYMRQHTVFNY